MAHHKDLHVEQLAHFGHMQHQDALNDDHVRGLHMLRMLRPLVRGEVVDGHLDGLHRLGHPTQL